MFCRAAAAAAAAAAPHKIKEKEEKEDVNGVDKDDSNQIEIRSNAKADLLF